MAWITLQPAITGAVETAGQRGAMVCHTDRPRGVSRASSNWTGNRKQDGAGWRPRPTGRGREGGAGDTAGVWEDPAQLDGEDRAPVDESAGAGDAPPNWTGNSGRGGREGY
ncbi:hypothetical protein GCM10020260_04890 [Nesterenkonia halobia]|uniref:Uncharacterized protein n=1 Tax=Nesterenkonia halobia TaxID=37922 RepID=A0ABP6RBE7_9MICC